MFVKKQIQYWYKILKLNLITEKNREISNH